MFAQLIGLVKFFLVKSTCYAYCLALLFYLRAEAGPFLPSGATALPKKRLALAGSGFGSAALIL